MQLISIEHVDDINKACDLHLTEAFASAGLDEDLTGDSQDISQVSHSTMSSRMQDVTSQQDRRELRELILTTSKRVWDMYTNTSAADKATLDSGSLNAESELGMEEQYSTRMVTGSSLR